METREVALIGRLIAGMTHETKNVLAIIKESSGLLQDILRMKKSKGVDQAEQIEKAAVRIKAQVARGADQLATLNWLAHSMSDRSTSIGVNELCSGVVNLTQRFARLKQVELELQPADEEVTIEADVVGLLFALTTCIEFSLPREPAKGRLVLRAGSTGREAILTIAGGSAEGPERTGTAGAGAGPLPAELSDLEPVLGPLGARVTFADAGAGSELQLTVPLDRGEDR
jgi:signal transduction histidine kinase